MTEIVWDVNSEPGIGDSDQTNFLYDIFVSLIPILFHFCDFFRPGFWSVFFKKSMYSSGCGLFFDSARCMQIIFQNKTG